MTSSNALIGGSLMIRYHLPSGLKHLVVLLQLSERASLCLKHFFKKGGKMLGSMWSVGSSELSFFHEVKIKHLTF